MLPGSIHLISSIKVVVTFMLLVLKLSDKTEQNSKNLLGYEAKVSLMKKEERW